MNLVAQDTTRYGEDIYGKLMLPELIREVCKVDGVHWCVFSTAIPSGSPMSCWR